MAELTQKQREAAILMKCAVRDFSNNFITRSKTTLRLNFPELTIFLYSIEMKDNYFFEEDFAYYVKTLFKESLHKLQKQHPSSFHDHFTSLKLVRYLPHIKSMKVESLFSDLKKEITTK